MIPLPETLSDVPINLTRRILHRIAGTEAKGANAAYDRLQERLARSHLRKQKAVKHSNGAPTVAPKVVLRSRTEAMLAVTSRPANTGGPEPSDRGLPACRILARGCTQPRSEDGIRR